MADRCQDNPVFQAMTSTAGCPYGLSEDFEWRPEHQSTLEHIASTDTLEPNTEWQLLREMIKYKLGQNIIAFLADNALPVEPSKPAAGVVDSSGNLRLPPFPPRKTNGLCPQEIPKARMNQEEANEMKTHIFRQLHESEDNPPFTIQRVCELCVYPRQHYKFIGKYLRAVEKSLLVTSTWNAFPIEPSQNEFSMGTFPAVPPAKSTPTTPMFSPIPFLHEDARRSKSQSPPPSPLALAVVEMSGNVGSFVEPAQRTIGLVDELDDPSPGHMSDHPTPITSTTTIGSRPFLETLETRFVKGSRHQSGEDDEQRMSVDETDDKENKDAKSSVHSSHM